MIEGTTPGAIKQRAHRAYVTLRGLLGKPDADADAPALAAAVERRPEPRQEARPAIRKDPS
jgi:hypothetical protein